MRLETILGRCRALELPFAKDEFEETEETPLPVPPYLVYIIPTIKPRGSDEKPFINEISVGLELYTDKIADEEIEKRIENEILYDVDYVKYQTTIQSEELVQTAYEFTILEKIRKERY